MDKDSLFKLMKERHSVRQYHNKPIEKDKRKILTDLIDECNRESGMHIQILFEEPKCFDSRMAHYGSFEGVRNYIALVGRRSPELEEKAGYYGEKIVLRAQEIGLNTCWVAMTHGKSAARILPGEKEACLIAVGYGKTQGAAHKNKALAEVCENPSDQPDWFIEGVRAALLAPTAVNQQKFWFSMRDGRPAAHIKGFGFYTKIDLGIVKYHFKAVTGEEVK